MSDPMAEVHRGLTQLRALVTAVNACIDSPDRRTICAHMIQEADELSRELEELAGRAITVGADARLIRNVPTQSRADWGKDWWNHQRLGQNSI